MCSTQARLVTIAAAHKLKVSQEVLEARLEALLYLVPDLGEHARERFVAFSLLTDSYNATLHPAASKVVNMKPSILAALLGNLDVSSQRLLELKEIFPDANISLLVAAQPELLFHDTREIGSRAAKLKSLLDDDKIDRCTCKIHAARNNCVP